MSENMFVWYRPQQMSHHHDFNSFVSESENSDAKMTISAHNICQNNGKFLKLRRSTQAALCTTYAKLM